MAFVVNRDMAIEIPLFSVEELSKLLGVSTDEEGV
jgi:hypothetical protein